MDDVESWRQQPLKDGDSWFVVALSWYERYQQYVAGSLPSPGEIDQSDILELQNNQLVLKQNLEEELDYVLVPESGWKILKDEFGGPSTVPIERKVIAGAELAVEVYPVIVELECESGQTAVCSLSRTATLGDVKELVKRKFGFLKCKVWLKQGDQKEVVPDSYTLEQLASSRLAFYVQNSNSWSEDVMPNLSKMYRSDSFDKAVDNYKPNQGGLVGLTNLGNTCFMNSSLQCLSNTEPLTQYFLSNEFAAEINRTNPLGMGGHIAEAFGNLVKEMWRTGSVNRCVVPRDFKYTIGRFAPQFSGYRQHDSQELLAFLLDGLHEDLNRVKQKPYIEVKDSDGRPHKEVADEIWSNHKLRNDSIIVDLFQGLFKSTLVCPECSHVSITFDPFMFISLPLPTAAYTKLSVTVVAEKFPVAAKTIQIGKSSFVADLKQEISNATSIPAENLVLCDVFSHKIYQILDNDRPISSIGTHDKIYAYEVPFQGKIGWVLFNEVGPVGSTHFGIPLPFELNGAEKDNPKALARAIYSKLQSQLLSKADFEGLYEQIKIERQSTEIFVAQFSPALADECFGRHKEVFMGRADDPKTEEENTTAVTLKDCFRLFTKEERLGSSDPWYCPKCKKHQQATKKFDLWKMPSILVIHLKRFSYSRIFRDKLDTAVEFPIEWTLF